MKRLICSVLILLLCCSALVGASPALLHVDGQLQVSALVENPSSQQQTGVVYVALYQNKTLLALRQTAAITLPAGAQRSVEVLFDSADWGEELSAQAMFWADGQQPITVPASTTFLPSKLAAVTTTTLPLTTEYALVINHNNHESSAGVLPQRPAGGKARLQTKEAGITEPTMLPLDMPPALMTSAATPLVQPLSSTVGDQRNFITSNHQTGQDEQVSATLLYLDDTCELWIADDQAHLFTDSMLTQIAQEFSGYIYPTVTQYFGSIPTIDGPSRVKLFYYDIKDSFSPQNMGYYGGYFSSQDLTQRNDIMLHLDTWPSLVESGSDFFPQENCTYDVAEGFGTIAHELQHLVNYGVYYDNYRNGCRPMGAWLDEAFAMSAETILYGVQQDRIAYINNHANAFRPGISLIDWQGRLENYSLSYLFGQYLQMQTQGHAGGGKAIYHAVLNSMAHTPYEWKTNYSTHTPDEVYWEMNVKSTVDVSAALSQAGLDLTFAQFVNDFFLALYLKQAAGPYGFHGVEAFDQLRMPTYSPTQTALVLPPKSAVLVQLDGPFVPSGADNGISFIGINFPQP